MIIDRENYEVWMIDWLDGKLDELQTKCLLSFLRDNPDLREETESLSSICLNPSTEIFSGKNLLKKTALEISDSQFEILCIGHLENDLNSEKAKELEEIIQKIPGRKKLFDLFRQIKLFPPACHYNRKERLKKNTIARKIIRLPVLLTGAAATIALIIAVYSLIPGRLSDKTISSEKEITFDTLIINYAHPILTKRTVQLIDKKENVNNKKQTSTSPVTSSTEIKVKLVKVEDSLLNPLNIKSMKTPGFLYPHITDLGIHNKKYNLISYDPKIINTNINYNRSRLGKLIARTYRSLILREEKASDLPLKAYEYVEGGINGLNKLLGWEMALQKTNDENGELKSYYFSSKILKFNAPVKKPHPAL